MRDPVLFDVSAEDPINGAEMRTWFHFEVDQQSAGMRCRLFTEATDG